MLVISAAYVYADLDVNAVAGTATIDGSPAPQGTVIRISDATSGHTTTTQVDGPNVPPFQKGQGRFDTGDVSQFSTGDTVTVSFQSSVISGGVTTTLSAGTTNVNLQGSQSSPPSVSTIPEQNGLEDVPWDLDLEPYLSDPDTPKSSLQVMVYDDQVSVDGLVLTFLYPEGMLADKVKFYVSDGTTVVTAFVDVKITPVNDPPVISEIPVIALMEGSSTSLDLSPLIYDPDNALESLAIWVEGGALVDAWVVGLQLHVSAPESELGVDTVVLSVEDPGGLRASQSVSIEVGANVTALMDHYEAQIDELNAQIAALQEENSNLSSRVTEILTAMSQLESEKASLEGELEEALSETSGMIEELDQLRSQAGLDAETIEALEEEKLNLSMRVDALQQQLDATISYYAELVAGIESTRDGYVSQIQSLHQSVAALQANITQLELDAGSNQTLIQNLTAEKELLLSEISQKEGEVANLEQMAQTLNADVASLMEERDRAEAALAEMDSLLAELRDRNSELQAELDELKNKSPAQMVNGTENVTQMDEPTMAEGIFGTAARLARGGMKVLTQGVDSTAAILIVAVIALVSCVVIAVRSSWSGMGSGFNLGGGRQSSSSEYWRGIESRARAEDSETSTQASHGVSSHSTTSVRGEGMQRPSTFVKVKKTPQRRPPSPSPPRPTKRVVASVKPISATRVGIATPRREAPKIDTGADAVTPVQPETTRPPGDQGARAPERGAPRSEKARLLDASVLSKVDREYIKALIEMGYTREAEEELRKRTSLS